eukprot:247188-Rhodomonas_salina.3
MHSDCAATDREANPLACACVVIYKREVTWCAAAFNARQFRRRGGAAGARRSGRGTSGGP